MSHVTVPKAAALGTPSQLRIEQRSVVYGTSSSIDVEGATTSVRDEKAILVKNINKENIHVHDLESSTPDEGSRRERLRCVRN